MACLFFLFKRVMGRYPGLTWLFPADPGCCYQGCALCAPWDLVLPCAFKDTIAKWCVDFVRTRHSTWNCSLKACFKGCSIACWCTKLCAFLDRLLFFISFACSFCTMYSPKFAINKCRKGTIQRFISVNRFSSYVQDLWCITDHGCELSKMPDFFICL